MWPSIGRLVLRLPFVLLKVACAYHLFALNIGGPRMVYGPSMLPTFDASASWVIEDALSVRLRRPYQRGELVVLDSPRSPHQQICKRVIGLPGDIICVDPTGQLAPSTEHCIIPQGHIWIAGDNAAGSIDSRTYGPVPIALVKARIIARIYPFNAITFFSNEGTILGKV